MKKLESLDDLLKAAGHLAGHFSKAAAHHSAYADAHSKLANEHTAMSAFHQGHADAAADDSADKAMHKRHAEHHATKAAHHTTLHKAHKDYADHLSSVAAAYGEEKAAAATSVAKTEPADSPSGVVADIFKGMAGDLTTMTQDMIKNDPTVKEMLRKSIAEAIGSALGNKIQPDNVHAVHPSQAPDEAVLAHLNLVPRAGQPRIEKASVGADAEEMFVI